MWSANTANTAKKLEEGNPSLSLVTGSIEEAITSLQEKYHKLINQVDYSEWSPELPKLIFRAANIAWVNPKEVEDAYKTFQSFKETHGIIDVWNTQEQEIALAVYIYTYNLKTKSKKVEQVLRELGIGRKNLDIVSLIKDLCEENAEPSEKKETPAHHDILL